MTTRYRAPQSYCEQLTDHQAHTVPFGPNALPLYHCPGRHTGHGFETTAPIAHPMDTDPFAGTDSIWD